MVKPKFSLETRARMGSFSQGWIAHLSSIAVAVTCLFAAQVRGQSTRDYAVELTAVTQDAPPSITLNWPNNWDGQQYYVQRKAKNASQWESNFLLSAEDTTFIDTNVVAGGAYEYSVTKYPAAPFRGSGYLFAGIGAPLVEQRGKVILVVESTHAADLSVELNRLLQDLAGDGWTVIRRNVARTDSPAYVKGLIQSEWSADPDNVRAVFLLGRVPVPYSGNYNADDHSDHTGAWVADTYYADMNGTWTDSTVRNTRAARPINRNIPGDGKFDQTFLPSDLELEVGRVDFANMPAFLPRTEKDLLRAYLDKNHRFRHGLIVAQRRGLIFDGFGESGGEAHAASGWRNFAPFFSPGSVTEIGWNEFFPVAGSQDYLWAYLAGGGGSDYTSCYGVGVTDDFAATSVKTIFTMVFGSYFGDWDAPNDFMRAALASGNTLTAAWAGRPHWYLHHMAMGETIGYSTRLSQNNSGIYIPDDFTRHVHISLLGDPTLRMHVVPPPSSLTALTNGGSIALSWSSPSAGNLAGYHVYRSISPDGPFVRLTGASPISSPAFSESLPGGTYTYVVRAIKLEESASGSYFNSSQGIFLTTNISPASLAPMAIVTGRMETGGFSLRIRGEIGQRFVIERSADFVTWTTLFTNTLLSAMEFQYLDSQAAASARRYYRTRLQP